MPGFVYAGTLILIAGALPYTHLKHDEHSTQIILLIYVLAQVSDWYQVMLASTCTPAEGVPLTVMIHQLPLKKMYAPLMTLLLFPLPVILFHESWTVVYRQVNHLLSLTVK